MTDTLISPIAASLGEWDVPHVELAIFGTAEAPQIAKRLEACCVGALNSPPIEVLFYQSSVGTVAGVKLASGQRVVVKAHQPSTTREHLAEVVRLQSIIAAKLGLAPKVLAGPMPLGFGAAIIEEFVDRGSIRNGHDAAVRAGLARALHAVVECLSAEYQTSDSPRRRVRAWCPWATLSSVTPTGVPNTFASREMSRRWRSTGTACARRVSRHWWVQLLTCSVLTGAWTDTYKHPQ